ncbi:uncharacterized protein LOC135848041 [Planococcus citri]|uniref:uncharacterized protein LOC135848041 n=1 Tax=Planococcus citri TaxID=170843 RepID=UPI0031F8E3A7
MAMTTSSKMYAASAIFVMISTVNLIVCVKKDPNSLEDVNISETNQHVVEPLSQKIYSKDVCELLSTDIFKQADPFHYLLLKASKLPREKEIEIRLSLNYLLTKTNANQFPPAYVPYGKILSSVLNCFGHLYSVKYSIRLINNPRRKYPLPPPPKVFTLDPEVSPLFSSDIFTDPNRPSVLIEKLLQVPESSYLSTAKKLISPKTHYEPKDAVYSLYSGSLSQFLQNKIASKELKDLRRYVGEIQKLKTSTPADDQSEQK